MTVKYSLLAKKWARDPMLEIWWMVDVCRGDGVKHANEGDRDRNTRQEGVSFDLAWVLIK